MKRLRVACIVISVVLALFGFIRLIAVVVSVSQPSIYQRDLLDTYILLRAVHEGDDPYPDIAVQAPRYVGLSSLLLVHPPTRPPIVGVLLSPLGMLSYRSVAYLWLTGQLVALWIAMILLLRMFKISDMFRPVVLVLGLFSWPPVLWEVYWLNYNSFLLLLVTGSLDAYSRDCRGQSGLLLGLAVMIKPTVWPLIVLLGLRREWTALSVAASVLVTSILVPAFFLGLEPVSTYFLVVTSEVSWFYRNDPFNQSLWTIGPRLFEGLGWHPLVPPLALAPPMFFDQTLAPFVRYTVPVLAMIVGLVAAWRMDTLAGAACVTLGVAILVSPIAWEHYETLLLISAAWAVKRLREAGWPRSETISGSAIAIASFVGGSSLTLLRLAYHIPAGEPIVLSSMAGFVTLVPAAIVIAATAWAVWVNRDLARTKAAE